RVLRRYLAPYRRQVAIVTALLLLQSVANLYLPNLNADIINNGVAKGDTDYIWRIGALMLGITLVLGVFAIVAVYFASETSMSVGRDVRAGVFERVQSFSAREMNRFGTASLITRNTNDVQQVQLFLQIALTILVSAPILAIGGIVMAVREDATLSWLIVVIVPLMTAVFMVILVPRAEASAQRIVEVLETRSSIAEPLRPVTPQQLSGLVVFADVTFAYPHGERPVLHGLTFEARPGRTTAIIGGTGSGKSTVVSLVTRSLDVTSGVVLVDRLDVREQALAGLWSRIGLVPQTAYLFKGTVAQNLRFGNETASDAQLWRALEVAQARDFV